MKTKIMMVLAGIAFAVVVTMTFAPAALAQGPGGGQGGGHGPGMGGMGNQQNSLVAVAAQQLGMTQAALVAELENGKSIAQLAEAKQVTLDTIVTAFVAPRVARMDAAVAAGRMTRAEADAMLATMKANVTARLQAPWSPQGNGLGAGFTDENGDGVCDHAGGGHMGGTRNGRMMGQ